VSQTTGPNEAKQFIGQYKDTESNLQYLNARYYNSTNGQFLSEDSKFLDIPSHQDLKDPQTLNSYAYSNDNPVVVSDPSGNGGLGAVIEVPALVLTALYVAALALSAILGTL